MLFQPRQPLFLNVWASCRMAASELSQVQWEEWEALNSPSLNPLHYQVWVTMLQKYHKLQSMPTTTDELKVAQQTIWEEQPQEHVNNAVANFTKCLTACASLPMVVTSSICSNSVHLQVSILISSPNNRLSAEPPTDYQEDNTQNAEKCDCLGWNSILFSFWDVSHVVLQCYKQLNKANFDHPYNFVLL